MTDNQQQQATEQDEIQDLSMLSEESLTLGDAFTVELNKEITNNIVLDNEKIQNRAIIFVMSGIHKGAGCPVIEETKIGSSYDADLIITDSDIVANHLILSPIEQGLDFGIQVTCKGDSLIIDGMILLTTEQSMIMKETFVITIGAVSINVTLHKAPKTRIAYRKYIKPHVETVNLVRATAEKYLSPTVIVSDIRNILLLVIGVLGISFAILYFALQPKSKEAPRSSYAQYKNVKHLITKEKDNLNTLYLQAQKDLQHVLRKYDLANRLHVFVTNNTLYVEGKINSYEYKNWGKVLNWFDTTYGIHVGMIPLITLNNGQRRTISFKAIVTRGSMPYVVSWTGDRYRLGATLPGGWIILDINDDGVLVKDAIDNRQFLVQHIRSSVGEAVPTFEQ